jgi:hypothetical protein
MISTEQRHLNRMLQDTVEKSIQSQAQASAASTITNAANPHIQDAKERGASPTFLAGAGVYTSDARRE